MVHRGRVDRPVSVRQLPHLDGVVADGGEPIAARLPGQQHAACLHLLLWNQWAARGLGARCGGEEAPELLIHTQTKASHYRGHSETINLFAFWFLVKTYSHNTNISK